MRKNNFKLKYENGVLIDSVFALNYKNNVVVTVRIIKNPKLSAVKSPRYFKVLPLTWDVYSRKVIKLAREEMSVPTPPILTPRSNSR